MRIAPPGKCFTVNDVFYNKSSNSCLSIEILVCATVLLKSMGGGFIEGEMNHKKNDPKEITDIVCLPQSKIDNKIKNRQWDSL